MNLKHFKHRHNVNLFILKNNGLSPAHSYNIVYSKEIEGDYNHYEKKTKDLKSCTNKELWMLLKFWWIEKQELITFTEQMAMWGYESFARQLR